MIEQRGHHRKRNRIAERQAMIAGMGAKHPFRFLSHTVSIRDDIQVGFHLAEEFQRGLCGMSIAEQCHRFADDIPGRAPGGAGRSRFRRQAAGFRVIGVLRVKAGVEKMTCRETPEEGEPSADRAALTVEMGLDVGRDGPLRPAPFRQAVHDSQKLGGGGSRDKVVLHGAKLRHDLVVHGDLHARCGVPLNASDQGGQSLSRFADRQFHRFLQ